MLEERSFGASGLACMSFERLDKFQLGLLGTSLVLDMREGGVVESWEYKGFMLVVSRVHDDLCNGIGWMLMVTRASILYLR